MKWYNAPTMFEDLQSPDAAYAVGLLQTDGTHEGSVDGKGRVSVEVAARDHEVLSRLAQSLGCYSSIGRRTRSTNFGDNYETATLRFYDQRTRRLLVDAGVPVGRKARTISPPTMPFAAPDYVRGLLDGDGSIGFTRKGEPFISMVTASPDIAQYLCVTIGEVCGVTRTARPNARDDVFNVMVLNQAATQLASWAWYDTEVVGIRRKKSAAVKVAAWTPPAGKEGRYGVVRRAWTAEDDSVVLGQPTARAAEILGRTLSSVSVGKWRLRQV